MKKTLGILSTSLLKRIASNRECFPGIALPGVEAWCNIQKENIILLKHNAWGGAHLHRLGGIAAKAYPRRVPAQGQTCIQKHLLSHVYGIFLNHARKNSLGNIANGLLCFLTSDQHSIHGKSRAYSLCRIRIEFGH